MDAQDTLREFRDRFHLPLGKDGKPLIYFAGNSLGLMPKSAKAIVEEELNNWAKLAVDAHHAAGTPWYTYHEALRETTARSNYWGLLRRCVKHWAESLPLARRRNMPTLLTLPTPR